MTLAYLYFVLHLFKIAMVKIPIFGKLTEAQENLIDEGYVYGSLATVCILSSLKKKRGEWKVKGA